MSDEDYATRPVPKKTCLLCGCPFGVELFNGLACPNRVCRNYDNLQPSDFMEDEFERLIAWLARKRSSEP